jgi:hypothetical protein
MIARLRCELRGLVATLIWPAFWRSLVVPPLVVVDGHAMTVRWSEPAAGPGGLVEWAEEACADCGLVRRDRWRRWWGW